MEMTATTETGVEGQGKDFEDQPVQPDPTTLSSTGTGVHTNDNGGPQAHTETGGVQPLDNGGPQAHADEKPVA
jgi:hypothetical protein